MPPQAPQPVANPALLNYLKARYLMSLRNGTPQGVPGTPAPNSLPVRPVMPAPANAPAQGPQLGARPQATPNQQVMKAAAQAQSPLMEPQTRQIAKTLVQKLLQHM